MTSIVVPEGLVALIQLGVAAVACWFMWDISKTTLNNVKVSIDANTEVIRQLCEKLGESHNGGSV